MPNGFTDEEWRAMRRVNDLVRDLSHRDYIALSEAIHLERLAHIHADTKKLEATHAH